MSGTEEGGTKGLKFSMTRLMVTILVVLLIAVVAYQYGLQQVPQGDSSRTKRIFGLDKSKSNILADIYSDADGDRVADPPQEAARWIDPQAILFSYVAAPNSEAYEKAWRPLADHISEVTGKPVQYVRFESARDQMLAMREGRLHVTAMNTGNVPEAVSLYGFVPVGAPSKDDGSHGYTMKIIVPAASAIKGPKGLTGHNIAFTDPGSNSGRKAPMVLLMSDFGLEPDRDYHFVFSGGHEESIAGVASGKYEAAAVASDMLDRAVARGDIEASAVRSIYESEKFPAAAVGYVYNLKPELADKVREALLGFKVTDTSITDELAEGVVGFAPVSYKDDWALIRRIDSNVAPSPRVGAASGGG
jgi:phosphonate transport system substrate-binding protein